MDKKLFCYTILASSLFGANVSAADVSINGFASIRASVLDYDGPMAPFPDFKGNGDVSFKDESLFALQARAELGEGLSATIQLMSEGQNDFDVEARWAYLSYELSQNHKLSAGRFANPIFHKSEFEKVGYAHNFARLPRSVYGELAFSTMEGITLDSNFELGDYLLTTKFSYGNWDGEQLIEAAGGYVELGLKNIVSGRLELSGDWWTLFGGAFTSEIEGGGFDELLFSAFVEPATAAALANGATLEETQLFTEKLLWGGKDGIYAYVGGNINFENVVFDIEVTEYGAKDSSDGFDRTWYVALGYRFTPSLLLTIHREKLTQDEDLSFLDSISDPILVGTGYAVHQAIIELEQEATGITLRYDFHPSAALKVDYVKGEDKRAVVGDYTVASIGIDVVF